MNDITKEDVFYSMVRLQEFIRQMSDEDFQNFVSGRRPIFSAMIPPKYELLGADIIKEYNRSIVKLEFRIS